MLSMISGISSVFFWGKGVPEEISCDLSGGTAPRSVSMSEDRPLVPPIDSASMVVLPSPNQVLPGDRSSGEAEELSGDEEVVEENPPNILQNNSQPVEVVVERLTETSIEVKKSTWDVWSERLYVLNGFEHGKGVLKVVMIGLSILSCGLIPLGIYAAAKLYDSQYFGSRVEVAR